MIKYLGSKRVLADRIARIARALAASRGAAGTPTALDPFTGTTRVAQALRTTGFRVHASDSAAYAATFARCYVAAEPCSATRTELARRIAELDGLVGVRGYVTRTFCEEARFLHPDNGARVDAIRAAIDALAPDEPVRSVLLTSLVEAADRVDSTVGVQMAFLKQWAPRALRRLELRMPDIPDGPRGTARRGDAVDVARAIGPVDLAYLDPPYNQHSYLGNYHVWETIVRADEPEAYGIARKRIDVRTRRSPWNSRRAAPAELERLLGALDARWVLLSFNVEGYVAPARAAALLAARDVEVAALAIPHPRYVGSQIGIHAPDGRRVGTSGARSTHELLFLSGPGAVEALARGAEPGDELLDLATLRSRWSEAVPVGGT